jgi:hypothetical protein
MLWILRLIVTLVIDLFKSRRRLEAENLFLRRQLNIALRRASHRFQLRRSDRVLLVWMIRLMPNLLDLSQIVRPETILRWHRAGFRAYWRWKSRGQVGRPRTDRELRQLIRRMRETPGLWWGLKAGQKRSCPFRKSNPSVNNDAIRTGSASR